MPFSSVSIDDLEVKIWWVLKILQISQKNACVGVSF